MDTWDWIVIGTIYFIVLYYFLTIRTVREKRLSKTYPVLVGFTFIALVEVNHYARLADYFAIPIVLLISGIIYFYLLRVHYNKLSIDTPAAYMSVYFACLLLMLLTSSSESRAYPEIFILAVMFASLYSGRKVTTGVSVMSIATIIFLYLNNPVAMQEWRIASTLVLLVALPQALAILYEKVVKDYSIDQTRLFKKKHKEKTYV